VFDDANVKTGDGNMNLIWNDDSGHVKNLYAEKHNIIIYIVWGF
jgi:hypothetical protein